MNKLKGGINMNGNLLTMFMIGVLVLGVSGFAIADEDDEVRADISKIDLDDVSGGDATAFARIKVKDMGDLHKVKIKLKAKNLDQMDNYVFEGWLVDEDTGYKLSLGAFNTHKHKNAKFSFEQKLVNFEIYDLLVITQEPIDDTIPTPDTPILVGALN
jgi:hypothetical protein